VIKSRVFLMVCSFLAVGAVVAAPAGAGAKGGFAPETGKYAGTFDNGKTTAPVVGTVKKAGSKYEVQALVGTAAKCSNGTVVVGVPLGLVAPVAGKTFKLTEKVEILGAEGLRIWTVKLSGRFTSEKAFTGTVLAESPPVANNSISPSCATPTVSFKLKHE
jgi:hypothetical protein